MLSRIFIHRSILHQSQALWEELGECRPVHSCIYGGVQPLVDLMQKEYVFTFLMGLNQSYSQIRGQILILDPMPEVNRVFSLILQDEQQREVGNVHYNSKQ